MTLERAIGLLFLVFSLAYGYEAYFGMDDLLPPILQRTPVWPSSFPKILAVCGVLAALAVIVSPSRADTESRDIDHRRLLDYNLGQALTLIGLMIAYALLLRPIGFLAATTLFLALGAFILGERRYHWMVLTAAIGAVTIWYLVQEVLGIFLRPWPSIL